MKKNILLIALITFNFIVLHPLKAQNFPFNIQGNQLSFTDSSGKNSIIVSRGHQVKINDDERKLFYQDYDSKSKIMTVKDISYKVFYTKHTKIEYNLDDIHRIQLRMDDTRKRAQALWYPGIYAHMLPQAAVVGVTMAIVGGITGAKDINSESPVFKIIYIPGMALSLVNAVINTFPTASKLGKGEWISIPLEGEDAWELAPLLIN